jgi:hypothetical protein
MQPTPNKKQKTIDKAFTKDEQKEILKKKSSYVEDIADFLDKINSGMYATINGIIYQIQHRKENPTATEVRDSAIETIKAAKRVAPFEPPMMASCEAVVTPRVASAWRRSREGG